MPRLEINGHQVDFDSMPSEDEIDEVGGSLGSAPSAPDTTTSTLPQHVDALIAHESSGNPKAVGDSGLALGLGQMHPEVRRAYGVTPQSTPDEQKAAVTKYLGSLFTKHGGNADDALSEYHLGAPKYEKGRQSPANLAYLEKHRTFLGKQAPAPEPAAPSPAPEDDFLGESEQPATPAPQRSAGESLYDRTLGRASRESNALADTLRDPDVELPEKLKTLGHGIVHGILTAAFPGYTAAGVAGGVAGEKVFGSKEAGDTAEVAVPLAMGVGGLVKAGAKGAAGLLRGGGKALGEEVAGDVGASTTAEEAGQLLKKPGEGAGQAIENVAGQASDKYAAAQAAARESESAVPAGDRSLLKAFHQARRDAKAAGGSLPTEVRSVMKNVVRRGRKAVEAESEIKAPEGLETAGGEPIVQPKVMKTEAQDTPVADLIDEHSNLSRALRKMPGNHPGRRAALAFKEQLEGSIEQAAQSNPKVAEAWSAAKKFYREDAAPTKMTAGKALKAETPEQAARGVTNPRTPTKLERITKAAPSTEEPLVGSAWKDALDKATEDGKISMKKLSSLIPKDPKALAQWANTPARKVAVKAIQHVSRVEKGAGLTGAIVGGAAGTEFGIPGVFGGGYVGRKIAEGILNSEPAARAFYRLGKMKAAGSPGWHLAAKALMRAVGKSGAAATGRALEQESPDDR